MESDESYKVKQSEKVRDLEREAELFSVLSLEFLHTNVSSHFADYPGETEKL